MDCHHVPDEYMAILWCLTVKTTVLNGENAQISYQVG